MKLILRSKLLVIAILLGGVSGIGLLAGQASAQFGLPSCPGTWVSAGGGMMCLCPDGSYAGGYPVTTCPTRRAPQRYYPPARTYTPPPDPRALEAARKAEAERQRAMAEQQEKERQAAIAREEVKRRAEVNRHGDALRHARERDEQRLTGRERTRNQPPPKVSSILLSRLEKPSTVRGGKLAWANPNSIALPRRLAPADTRYLERVLRDGRQPLISRRLAAAVLGEPIPSVSPSAAAKGAVAVTSKRSDIERQLEEIAFGKAPLSAPAPGKPMSFDDKMRLVMSDPRETLASRQLAAIALGLDPNSVRRLNVSPANVAASAGVPPSAPGVQMKPATIGTAVPVGKSVEIGAPAPAPSTAPLTASTSAPTLKLNPNLTTNIARLTPPRQPAAPAAPPATVETFKTPTSTFAPPVNNGRLVSALDRETAKRVLPYALLSRDAYDNVGGNLGTATEWKRVANWDTVMAKNGVSASEINKIRISGFYAAVYQNQKTGDVAIAFRGTELDLSSNLPKKVDTARDLDADYRAIKGVLPIQYEAAGRFTSIVKSSVGSGHQITLTGHSLGGGLASYAGNEAGIRNVVTFNAARNYFSDGVVKNTEQLNIYSRGERIGDPNKSGFFGSGSLPGVAVGSESIAPESAHSIDNIIGTLTDEVLK